MRSVREALALGADSLRVAGIESARLDARVLLAWSLGLAPESVLAAGELSSSSVEHFETLIARRGRREPLAYITGNREFWSLSLAVGSGVLIPRPESETLVEAALREFPDADAPLRVLDIGTGSGCLILAFLSERPAAIGTGVDVSQAALVYTRQNAARLGLEGRVRLLEGSWRPPGNEEFDVVLVNPPYLTEAEFDASPPEIREHEPRDALAAGQDGLAAMRSLAPLLAPMLSGEGQAFLEIGWGQSGRIAEILGPHGLEVRRSVPDLSGVPRCLVVGRPGRGGT